MTKSTKKEKAPVSADNFKKRVAAVVRSGKSIRGNIQELAQYAMVAYLNPENNGNTADITYLYQQVAAVKSLNHRTLGLYLEDTVNIKLGKTSEGDAVFRKAVKGEAPSLRDDADLSANWWEHGRVTTPKAVDVVKLLETVAKNIAATQGDEAKREITAGQELVADELISKLKELGTWVETTVERRVAEAAGEADNVVEHTAAAA